MTNNWHVDDLKVSLYDKDIVDALMECTKETHDNIKIQATKRQNK